MGRGLRPPERQSRGRRALARSAPAQPTWTEIRNDLAWLLATHPDTVIRNGAEAVELAERVCASSAAPAHLATLAAAYAEAGRFDEAVATIQKAIRLTATAQQSATNFQSYLQLYQAHKTYHQPSAQ